MSIFFNTVQRVVYMTNFCDFLYFSSFVLTLSNTTTPSLIITLSVKHPVFWLPVIVDWLNLVETLSEETVDLKQVVKVISSISVRKEQLEQFFTDFLNVFRRFLVLVKNDISSLYWELPFIKTTTGFGLFVVTLSSSQFQNQGNGVV